MKLCLATAGTVTTLLLNGRVLNKHSNMKLIRIQFAIIVFLATSAWANAQQTIQLKDKYTLAPISNASIMQDKKISLSDQNGKILVLGTIEKLTISHIAYETIVLNIADIQKMTEKGEILMTPLSPVYLNPVTIYSVKGKSADEKIKLDNGDWVQHDAAQVLQQIPGFSGIRKSGSFGFDPVFRGLKYDQLNIVTDGALTSLAACPNHMDPTSSQVLVSQVQQIEILKGPHSFRFGPSMGAVINFKSPAPVFSDTLKVTGRINTGFESNGEVYRTEGVAGFSTKKLIISAIGSYSKGHNYKDGNDSIIPARFSRASAGLTVDYKLKENQLVQLSATRNFARTTDFPTLPMDLLSDDTWMLQAQYKRKGNHTWYTDWHTQVYASFVDHKMGNKLRPGAASILTSTDAATSTWGGRTEFTITRKKSQIFAGADFKKEEIDGNRIRKMITGPNAGKVFIDTVWQNGSLVRSGLFGEWHYLMNKFKISLAGRIDAVKGETKNPSSKFKKEYNELNNSNINTSMSAGISRQWNNNWQTGIWLGRGTRSASLSERYINSLPVGMDPYEMLGNPQLKPEANNQVDITAGYKSSRTFFQWSGFASIITNYITSKINPAIAPRFGAPGVRQYINIDKATLYGFEFGWQQIWCPALKQQLTFAYTYGKNNSSGNPLPEIAPADLRYRLEGKMAKEKSCLTHWSDIHLNKTG